MAASFRLIGLESAPPGLWRDEAFNGVFARGILQGSFAMYFMDKEPLFIYIQALSVALLGNTIFALRVVSALTGIGTVVAEYFMTRSLFGRKAAVIASLGLSISYWHVSMSRLSFRAIMVPLFATLVLYFFWRGLQSLPAFRATVEKKGLLFFVISGGLLGLSLYTYLSARFIPFVLVAFLCWMAIFYREPLKELSSKFAILVIVSLLVFAPMGIYYMMDPEAFLDRPEQVLAAGFGDGILSTLGVLLSGFFRTLGAFFVQGDMEWRHNIAGLPAMDFLTAAALAVGMGVALARFRRPESALILLSFGILLLPSSITIDNPHYLRAMAALPAAYAIAGLGAVWLLDKTMAISKRVSKTQPVILVGAGVIWLFLGPYATWNDYFNVWAKLPKTLEHSEAGVTEAAKYLNTLPQDSKVLFSAVYYPHSDVLYLSKTSSDLEWFDGNEGMLIGSNAELGQGQEIPVAPSPPEKDIYYILTGPSDRPLQLLKGIYPNGKVVTEKVSELGYPLFVSFLVPSESVGNIPRPSQPLSLKLGQDLDLLGFDSNVTQPRLSRASVNDGDNLQIAVYWRAEDKPAKNDYAFFAHLVDVDGKTLGQSDVVGYPSSQWTQGDVGITWLDIPVLPNSAPGKYSLQIGMYSRSDMKRLEAFDKSGKPLGDTINLFSVKVTSKANQMAQASQNANYLLGQKLALVSFGTSKDGQTRLEEQHLAPDSKISIRLVWQAKEMTSEDYTVFLQLLSADGRVVAQADSQPARGAFPTSYWDLGEVVVDDHEIAVPSNLPPGQYSLITGMYLLSTGERLKVNAGGDSINLGTITIGTR